MSGTFADSGMGFIGGEWHVYALDNFILCGCRLFLAAVAVVFLCVNDTTHTCAAVLGLSFGLFLL